MTLLTFLGTGNYQATTYRPCDFSAIGITEAPKEIATPYFSVALARWVQPERILVVTTPEASKKHREPFNAELSSFEVEFLELPLQTGSEADLWNYFQLLTNHLQAEEEIVADITHGFRSTPIVTLLALSYLRVTQNIRVRGLYYGAFDAVDLSNPIKPTFDLSAFLELFQWTSAADSFCHTGDATRLSELIHSAQQSLWSDSTRPKVDNPRALIPLARAIRESSADLRLLRMQDLGRSLEDLANHHQKAQEEIANFLPPFAQLIEVVTKDLIRHQPAALTNSSSEQNSPPDQTDLPAQLELISWLDEKGHTAAALTLSREWIVTCLAAQLQPAETLPLVYSKRGRFEAILNFQTSPKASDKGRSPDPDLLNAYQKIPVEKARLFEKLWSQTTAPRNDLNHANHNDHSKKSSALAETLKGLIEEFPKLLPEKW